MLQSEYLDLAIELYDIYSANNILHRRWLTVKELEKFKGGPGLISKVKKGKGFLTELKPIFFEYVDSKTRSKSCNTEQQWTCKFDNWLFNEYEFTNQELDELRSDKDGQGGCKTPQKVTNG